MDDLARLVALEEIYSLKARYFIAVDDKDWIAYAKLFTENACFVINSPFGQPNDQSTMPTLGNADTIIGGAAMAALLAQALAGTVTAHRGGMPVITFEGSDLAQARWPVEDRLWFGPGHSPATLHGFGCYDDSFVRTAEGWRITRLAYNRTRFA